MKRTRTERDAKRNADTAALRDTLEICFSQCTQQGMAPPLALVVVATVATKLAADTHNDGFDPTLHAARLLNAELPVPTPTPSLETRSSRRRRRRAEPLPFRDYVFGVRPRTHIPPWAKLFSS